MMLPTSEAAKRIHALFRRRPTTEWLPKEVAQFRVLVKAKFFETLDDLALVERYYAFERKKGHLGHHRRDLITCLNNWPGEVDKAMEWSEQHPVRQAPRKIIPLPLIKSEEPFIAPTDPESVAQLARFEAARQERKAKI